jgi:hypothetical protein
MSVELACGEKSGIDEALDSQRQTHSHKRDLGHRALFHKQDKGLSQ